MKDKNTVANIKNNSCVCQRIKKFSLFLSFPLSLTYFQSFKIPKSLPAKVLKMHLLKSYCFLVLAEVPGKEIMLFQDFDDLQKPEPPSAAHSRFPRHTEGHPAMTHLCPESSRHSSAREIQSTFPPSAIQTASLVNKFLSRVVDIQDQVQEPQLGFLRTTEEFPCSASVITTHN